MKSFSKLIRAVLMGMLMFASWAGMAVADVVVIVAADSPVESLSKTHIANIFLGRDRYLKENLRAIPVDQKEQSTAREAFYELILDWTPANLKAHWARMIFTGRGKPPRQLDSDAKVKALVAGRPGAIGYVHRENVDETVKVLKTVR